MDCKELQSLFLRSVCISFIRDRAIRTLRHQDLGSFQCHCSRLPYITCTRGQPEDATIVHVICYPALVSSGKQANRQIPFPATWEWENLKLTHKNIVRHTGTNCNAHHQNKNSWNSLFRVYVYWVMHPYWWIQCYWFNCIWLMLLH